MLNTAERKRHKSFIGFWLCKREAAAFKLAARRHGGVSRALRRYVRRVIRTNGTRAAGKSE